MGNCVHYMYKFSRFVEKLNIQNCINLMGNCIRCTDCWICKKIEYSELCKFISKLWTIYVRIVLIYREYEFCGYVESTELRKSNWKLCTLEV